MIKCIVSLLWLSTLSSLCLLVTHSPVSALPIPSNFKRKEIGLRSAKQLLPKESEAVVVTKTTPEHKVYMKVLFPNGMIPTKEFVIDYKIHEKQPAYVRRGTLNSRYYYLLQIKPDGTVSGTSDDTSQYTKLEFHSVGAGLLRILGVATNRYLTITDTGMLTAEIQPTLNSVFKEHYLENLYQSFTSYKFLQKPWLVGLKRNGKSKRGPDTNTGQKATQFMIKYTTL